MKAVAAPPAEAVFPGQPAPVGRKETEPGRPAPVGRSEEQFQRVLVALGLVALSLRLAGLIDYDADIDSLRFALAVEDFDVLGARPHAPFYPVYVLLGQTAALLLPTPQLALGWVGAVTGAVTVVATAMLAREVASTRAGVVAGVLALASPFLWLTSQKLMSDMTGTALATLALWACAWARHERNAHAARRGRARTWAVVLLGLMLGVRLSYFPIALACAAVIAHDEGGARAWLRRFRDLALGVVMWLVPLIVVGGAEALVRKTWVQGVGHFTRWGGSIATVSSPSARLGGSAWGLWANVLGGAWLDAPLWRWLGAPIMVVLLLLAANRARPLRGWLKLHPELVVAAAAYLLWALFGQNVAYKPRHFAPLTPLLVVGLAVGCEELSRRTRVAGLALAVLALQWFIDGAVLVSAHRKPSPAAAIVTHLRAGGGAGKTVVTCDLARMIEVGSPQTQVIRVSGATTLRSVLEELGPGGGQELLITSECMSSQRRKLLAERGLAWRVAHARSRSRYVDSLWNELAMLELVAAASFPAD